MSRGKQSPHQGGSHVKEHRLPIAPQRPEPRAENQTKFSGTALSNT